MNILPNKLLLFTMENTIISFNCDSKWSNLKAIIDFFLDNNINMAALQDTPIQSETKKYPNNQHALILGTNKQKLLINLNKVNPDLSTHLEQSCENIHIQSIKASFYKINSPITIYNIYIKPRTQTGELISKLETLESNIKQNGASRTIILGDFNSLSTEWCPTSKTIHLDNPRSNTNENKKYINLQLTRGRLIKNFIDQLKLTCLNNQNTGYTAYNNYYGTESHIDLAIVGNKCLRTWNNVKTLHLKSTGNQTSGHKIIMIKQTKKHEKPLHHKGKLKNKTHIHHNIPIDKNKRIKLLNKAIANIKPDRDWISQKREDQIKYLNALSNCVYDYLKLTQEANDVCKYTQTSRTKKKKSNQIIINKLAIELKKCKASKKSSKIKYKITKWINDQAMKMAQKNTQKSELWCKMDAYSNLTIETTNLETMDENKINEIMLEKFPYEDRTAAQNIIKNDPSNLLDDITKMPLDDEIDNAIFQIRNKRHTGVEGIKFTTFIKQLDQIKPIITEICKISKFTSTIPDNCKTTLGKIIPKKKKGQFRIVHMATPMLCLIEQIILHQLDYNIEHANKINRRQYGFTPRRDRHDLITRIIETIMLNKLKTKGTSYSTIISLDIKGAFDNVNHEHLINKLYRTFGTQSSFVKWIAQFLLDKEIVLEFQHIRSKSTKICKGVPQGSCLGPVLWNFCIEDIITTLNKLNKDKFELLAYADDLIIIFHNEANNESQDVLHMLEKELSNIKLEIDPSKCSVMYTKLAPYKNNKVITINNQPISKVKDMSILGVNIKYNLKLKTDQLASHNKLLANIYKLERANTLGLINEKKDWDIVISSYIKSILINNNFPILAIDSSARKLISNYMIKIYKHIFNWPQNISEKLVKLIMKEQSIEIQIQRLIYKKTYQEEMLGYQLLLKTLKNEPIELDNHITNTSTTPTRRNPNPLYHLKLDKSSLLKSISNSWSLVERKQGSIIALLNANATPIACETIIHNQYNTGHFNNLAALTHLVQYTEEKERLNIRTNFLKKITLPSTNALLQALLNFKNHDHRIIELRESMLIHNWTISAINNDDFKPIKINILQFEQQNKTPTIYRENPDVTDYVENFKKLNELNNEEATEMSTNMTSFCRKICYDYASWSSLNPSWLSGKRMLTLSGLTNKQSGQLTHYNNIDPTNCTCINKHNNWVLHFALECEKTNHDNLDQRAMDLIKIYKSAEYKDEAIKEILNDRFKQQTLLRLLTRSSFNK